MSKKLIELSIIGNGMPELHLLAQEMGQKTEISIVVIKGITKRLKERIEKVMELAEKADLLLFQKIVQMQYENYLFFYTFVQNLSPRKMTKHKAARLLMMYQVMHVEDLTQLLDVYINLEKSINQQMRPKEQLKNLFAGDLEEDITEFVDRSYDENHPDNVFRRIIEKKYVYQEGVGLVPKSMLKGPIKIQIPGEERETKKK